MNGARLVSEVLLALGTFVAGAGQMLVNKEQLNPLHCVVGCMTVFKRKKQPEEVKNCYQIFRLLLNYEAEQRAYFPEQYKSI